MTELSLSALNVCGLKRRLNYPDFIEYIQKHDFSCVCETNTDSTDIVDIDGYIFLSKHRSQNYKRKSGGIGVYVKEGLLKHCGTFALGIRICVVAIN